MLALGGFRDTPNEDDSSRRQESDELLIILPSKFLRRRIQHNASFAMTIIKKNEIQPRTTLSE
jgi:hypothetical protein